MNNKDKNILILYGGWSDERLISLESGKAVYNSLKNNNFDVHAFDLYIDDLALLKEFIINNKDRIAQMVICPIIKGTLEEVDELPETIRGSGGFGSTGVK